MLTNWPKCCKSCEEGPADEPVVQTAGALANWHPHVHALVSRGGWSAEREWVRVAFVDEHSAELLFRHKVIRLALAVSTVFRHRETALQVLLFTSLPAVFLAGFSWPKEMIPDWLNSISLLLPSTAAIAGFLRINQMGAGLNDVATEWQILWCLVGLYFVLAWLAHARSIRRPVEPQ